MMRKIGFALFLALTVGGLWLYRSIAKAPAHSTNRKEKYEKQRVNDNTPDLSIKGSRTIPVQMNLDQKQLRVPTNDRGNTPNSLHFNLIELRRRIRAGDVAGALSMTGTLEASDAEVLNSMFGDISETLPEEDRAKLTGMLVLLIGQTPGDAALRFLFVAARDQKLLSSNDWTCAVVVLGLRQSDDAVPYLESMALETDLTRVDAKRARAALAALLVKDSRNYATRIAQSWGNGNDQTFWENVYSMQGALTAGKDLDFAPAIAFLQQRFQKKENIWSSGRRTLVELLESEAKKSGAQASRTWLTGELRTIVLNEGQNYEASEIQYYKEVIARLDALKD